MASAKDETETDRFYLQKVQILEDSDDEYQYEEVPVDEDFIPGEFDEGLDVAVRTLQEIVEDGEAAGQHEALAKPSVVQKPEVVDDFVRNFLVRMGMTRTLDCFQTEWYELQQRGMLNESDVGVASDLYTANQNLDEEVKYLKTEVQKYKDTALKAKETYVKLRKERDYHRMHHKRVVQDKNKLITDFKRLKRHHAAYEPTLLQLKHKYEVAMREKMLTQLERDRAMGQLSGLQSTLKSMETFKLDSPPKDVRASKQVLGSTQKCLTEEREKYMSATDAINHDIILDELPDAAERHPNDSKFPADRGMNPLLNHVKSAGHVTRSSGFHLSHTFPAHSHSISSLALHPRKQILVTASDDHTWKMWAVPAGDVIMTGEGHTDWLSDCKFHPNGSSLATTSGDTTVKVWDFVKAECVHTFTDHTLAVWSCSWHHCGDFLATGSMDNTGKVWDLNSLRCRFTLRGHMESVNSIEFLPFSNTLLTASADKTLSLWDARTGLCAQTFYGHMHSVNYATFNMRGDTVVSCDSYGGIKLWDVRTVSPMVSFDIGPHPANKVTFDPTGAVLGIACNDSTVKMYDIASGQVKSLVGHEDAVQCVLFDHIGEFMVTGGSDNTVRIWA